MLHQDAIPPESSPPGQKKGWSRTDKVLFAGLVASVLIQGVAMGFVAANMQPDGKIGSSESDTVLMIIGSLQAVQLVLNVLIGAASLNLRAVWGSREEPSSLYAPDEASSASRRASLVGVIALFFMSVLMFTGLYALAIAFDDKSFSHLIIATTPGSASSGSDSALDDGMAGLDGSKPGSDGASGSTATSVGISTVFAIVFFSVETQSLVGLGDVVPTTVATELIALAQQVVGVCFSVFIIAQVLPVFGKDAESAARREEDETRRKRRQHERQHAMRRFQSLQRHREAQLRASQLEESALSGPQSREAPRQSTSHRRSRQCSGVIDAVDDDDDGKASPLRMQHHGVNVEDLDEMIAAGGSLDLQDVDDLVPSSALLAGVGGAGASARSGDSGLRKSASMHHRHRAESRSSGQAAGRGILVGSRAGRSAGIAHSWRDDEGSTASEAGSDDDSDTASMWSESSGTTDVTGTDYNDGEGTEDSMSNLGGAGLPGAGLGPPSSPGSSVRSQWSMLTPGSRPPHEGSGSRCTAAQVPRQIPNLPGSRLLGDARPRARRSTGFSSHYRDPGELGETPRTGWCGACWSAITHDGTVTTLRRWARRRLVLLSVALQLMIGAVLAADPQFEDVLEGRKGLTEVSVLWGAVVLQVLQVGVIVFTSVKFAARAWSVTVLVLLQAYVALILAYAGIYLLLFFIGNDEQAFSIPQRAWEDPNGGEEPVQSSSALLALAFEFVYFAFAVQTSVGFGDVAPQGWYARIACVSHILISLVFNSIVLGYGLAHIGQAARRREEVKRALIRGRELTTDLTDFDQPTAAEQRRAALAAGSAVQTVPPSPKRLGMGVLRRPTARRLSGGGILDLAPEVAAGGASNARKLRAI
jgi:hypothetical protein